MIDVKEKKTHFIRQLIKENLTSGKHQAVITRFPPEPNGYLHIGHAKSICLNFGLAEEFAGHCFLRFDDTNPIKEEQEFVDAIIEDVAWLGFTWKAITYSSDYYQELYELALDLITQGKAYVDNLSMEEIRKLRGNLFTPGQESPNRSRSIAENLQLFQQMKDGAFLDGAYVLRAKIDMQAGNINMRDPVLYRIRHAHHQRTGNAWCIYPMYDYAHPISDALEKITHSLCTLEFQDHRPLYDWFIDNCRLEAKPKQTEFARLNLSHTVTSKRKLKELVDKKIVSGWDDPRLPTLCGMRKRGYPAAAIKEFCEIIGISRSDSIIDMGILEECVRFQLNKTVNRALAVLAPIRVVIVNYPEDKTENLTVNWQTNNEENITRNIPFTKELYIESSDFSENPPPGFFRLSLGQEIRLRHSYVIKCIDVIKNQDGSIAELHCTYDPDTLGKNPQNRKVKGVIHWVSIKHAHPVQILQYDRLFTDPNPAREDDFLQFLNKDSLQIKQGWCEPFLAGQPLNTILQFERLGYYCVNQVENNKVKVFHRVVDLKSTWEKLST